MTDTHTDLKPTEPRSGPTGYVALLGRPNTGKSTLLNTVLGQHLAAVSSKPQTTRRHLLGIMTNDQAQIIFLDAPGVYHGKLALHEAMDKTISKTLNEADLLVVMLDPTRAPGDEDESTAKRAAESGKPAIIAVNKTDLATSEQMEQMLAFYRQHLPEAPAVNIIATKRDQVEVLLQQIQTMLPVGPFLHDPDELTNAYERDIAAELIREAMLQELQQEIPHSVAVGIDSWKAGGKRVNIKATLYIERENHKAIIIGKGGKMIAKIREIAIRKVSDMLARPVTMNLFVKVAPDWRQRKQFLREMKLLD